MITRILAALPGIPLLLVGLGLVVQPAETLPQLSMVMLEGGALSTQLGDIIAFFLVGATMIFMGAYHAAPRWLLAGAALMSVAAIGRTIAWQVYGAEFATQSIAVEVISTIWLVTCAVILGKAKAS